MESTTCWAVASWVMASAKRSRAIKASARITIRSTASSGKACPCSSTSPLSAEANAASGSFSFTSKEDFSFRPTLTSGRSFRQAECSRLSKSKRARASSARRVASAASVNSLVHGDTSPVLLRASSWSCSVPSALHAAVKRSYADCGNTAMVHAWNRMAKVIAADRPKVDRWVRGRPRGEGWNMGRVLTPHADRCTVPPRVGCPGWRPGRPNAGW